MVSLRRKNKDIAVEARTGKLVNAKDSGAEEQSLFGWELEEKWAEAWRRARRADLR